MRIAFASDHAAVALKALLVEHVGALGHVAIDLGPDGDARVDYPNYGYTLARIADIPDYVAQWLGTIDLLVRKKGHDGRIQDALVPMVSMSQNERSGILGTVDRGLLVFKSQAVRRRTAA